MSSRGAIFALHACLTLAARPSKDSSAFLHAQSAYTNADTQDLPVMMQDDEKVFFDSFLSRAQNYLEFGAGGSTEFALRHINIQHIHSVESMDAWIKKLSEREDVASNMRSGRLNLVSAGIGPTKDLGFPQDNSTMSLWPRYSSTSALQGEKDGTKFDLILVDGRFRVACFLRALQRINPADVETTHLLIHDVGEPLYHGTYSEVLEFADKVDQVGTLAHYKKKKHVDERKLDEMASRYATMPGK